MKKNAFFIALTIVLTGISFSSCEETTTDDTTPASIYWNKSAAFRMQLKGTVKTMIEDSTTTTTFNESGNILSIVTTDDFSNTSEIYSYSNGKLAEIQSTTTGQHTYGDTVTLSYSSTGKYLPMSPYYFYETGLFYNLSAMNNADANIRFVASGDSMLMITTYTYSLEDTYSDTVSFSFDGGQFPVRMKSPMMYSNNTYATDGRFIKSVQGYMGEGMNTNTTTTNFAPNSQYQLITSVVNSMYTGENDSTVYTYNVHEDLIGITGTYSEQEFSDYVYDAKGNWTERSSRSNYQGSEWTAKIKQTRRYTYWND